MLSPLIQKLDALAPLSDDAKSRLCELPVRMVDFAPHEDLVRECELRGDVCVIAEGFAARYKAMDGGQHAILGFLLPGDVDEPEQFADRPDHGIVAITICKTVQIPRIAFDQLFEDSPELRHGFRRMARLEQTIGRMWLANMGQQTADRQAAHLLCELHVRLSAVGMGMADGFTNPLTQEQLANVLGISPVHVNRVMHHLRESELIWVGGHMVRFPSLAKIRQYANFDEGYLKGDARAHPLDREPELAARFASTVARAADSGDTSRLGR